MRNVDEIVRAFVSNEELMFEFIDSINNILKIGNCDDGCQFKTFCLLLKNRFEKNILLNEKKIFFIGQCLAYGQIFELLCKGFI